MSYDLSQPIRIVALDEIQMRQKSTYAKYTEGSYSVLVWTLKTVLKYVIKLVELLLLTFYQIFAIFFNYSTFYK